MGDAIKTIKRIYKIIKAIKLSDAEYLKYGHEHSYFIRNYIKYTISLRPLNE